MMKLKSLSIFLLFQLVAFLICNHSNGSSPQSAKPNILWLTAEDMSPEYIQEAQTPNINRLKEMGTTFTRAFATNPACSPSRSTLITGLRASTMGTHHLRSPFSIPDFIKGFPSFMRDIGYYTTNNVKTDYNTSDEPRLIEESWDENSGEAHWRDRPEAGQPFFSVFNYMHTHQSRIGFLDQEFPEISKYLGTHDPGEVSVPPFYPDTPGIRKTLARTLDAITAMDNEVGVILDQLQADGKADSTIVFFFSDHGVGLPRGKRLLYDSGLQVSLVVYVPPAFQDQFLIKQGEEGKLVSFLDFAPTVLHLAGLEPPDYMLGKPFFEKQEESREYVFGARDRIDEAIDLSRSVRAERYLYIRNYYPHISWNAPEHYSDRAPIRRKITEMAQAGELNSVQMTYAGPDKPRVELYDTWEDPHQINNLIESEEHQHIRETLRQRLRSWQLANRDLGFIPEEEFFNKTNYDKIPWNIGRNGGEYPLERILDAASLVGQPDVIDQQVQLLDDGYPIERYWASVGLRSSGSDIPDRAVDVLSSALQDEKLYVRVESAGALLKLGRGSVKAAQQVLIDALEADNPAGALRAARILQLLGPNSHFAYETMSRVMKESKDAEGSTYEWYIYGSLSEVLQSM